MSYLCKRFMPWGINRTKVVIIVGMQKLFRKIGAFIRKIVDFFYPPFSRFMSEQLFRYAVCGAANILFDWALFFLLINYGFHKQVVHLGFMALEAHTATLAITFPISTLSGFLLQKHVTFTASDLRGRTQLVRYLQVVGLNLFINYTGLKLFIEAFGFWETPSKMLVTGICILVSYLCQKHYTFKVQNK